LDSEVMVSVLVATYNHEKYIRETLDGILNQKTNFKYDVIVHDDASTDHTAEIVKEYEKKYPDIIRGIYQQTNQFYNCNISAKYLYPQIKGKYFAVLDGDDYWIDENKLQMQVDFLEKHPDYSMCMHNAIKFNNETGEKKVLNTFPKDGTYTQEEQILAGLGSNFPACASNLFRTQFIKDIPKLFCESRVMDYPIRQYYANMGKVYYFEKPMSVYRVSIYGSYMKMVGEDQSFYNNYTLEMIRFFEKFNDYTENRFQNILEKKINSDYYGYCVSIPKEQGIKKAAEYGLNIQKIEKYYKNIDYKNIDNSILELNKNVDYLFIYGTSRLATICYKQLENEGIEFAGYVVSDGQMKMDEIDHKKVFYLSEAVKNYENAGFILAVQPVNINDIEQQLQKYHVKNFCIPYNI